MSRRIAAVFASVACLGIVSCGQNGIGSGSAGVEDAVGVQVAHPSGVILQILSILPGKDFSQVDARVINGRDREIKLNPGSERSYILTESGEKRLLVAAPANEDLAIPPGQTINVSLIFAGDIPRNGQTLLVLNENGSDNAYTSSPGFRIALPLDLAGRGGRIGEVTTLSGMKANPVSRLGNSVSGGSTLGTGGQAQSSLSTVEALKSELGAVETERGTVVSLPGDVLFDFDKADIRADARPTLTRLAELIKASGDGAIRIEGHTDTKGDDDYNRRLSEQRAVAVKTFLSEQGISASQLTTIGLGELRPVAPNVTADGEDDEAGRQKNRRVEVILPISGASADATP